MKTTSSLHSFALIASLCSLTFASMQANACFSFPKKISLARASFENEVFTFPETDRGIAFEHNQTSFFFNHVTNQWCVFIEKVKKKDQDEAQDKKNEKPICINHNKEFHLTDDREGPNKGKEIGVFKVVGKSIFLYSNNGKDKDTSRPYLKLTDTTEITERNNELGTTEKIYKSAINVEAMSSALGVLGNFKIQSRSGGPLLPDGTIKVRKTRSAFLGGEESPIELTGKSVDAEGGCGGKTTIEPLSSGTGNGTRSGSESRGSGAR